MMDGTNLARYVRDRWPSISLLVASGKANLEESSRPVGSQFFSKRYSEIEITDAMARLLAR